MLKKNLKPIDFVIEVIPRPPTTMSHASKKFTPTKSIPRSKESIDAENAKYDAEMKRYLANKAFLDKVAEGERHSMNALAEAAKQKHASQQYPFQHEVLNPNPPTFQPRLMTPRWTYCDGW